MDERVEVGVGGIEIVMQRYDTVLCIYLYVSVICIGSCGWCWWNDMKYGKECVWMWMWMNALV